MRRLLLAGFDLCAVAGAAGAAEWRVQQIDTPARVVAVETIDGKPQVNAGGLWYRLVLVDGQYKLAFNDQPAKPEQPNDALQDSRAAVGSRDIARAWLAEPTTRYDHGILGHPVEANSLIVEGRDGKLQSVRLKDDAVFEDLEPRLADLDGDGHDEVVVVKSYLKRGSALAVIALNKGKYDIVAETPPIGQPQAWLNPAGIADYNGDGKQDIAVVRMPHAVGALELWTWGTDRKLRKTAEMLDVSNHVAGSQVLGMSATADFDGDGIADLAVPSFDRGKLRIVAFAPQPREIASVELPAKVVSNLVLLGGGGAVPPAIAVGLFDGSLVVVRRD